MATEKDRKAALMSRARQIIDEQAKLDTVRFSRPEQKLNHSEMKQYRELIAELEQINDELDMMEKGAYQRERTAQPANMPERLDLGIADPQASASGRPRSCIGGKYKDLFGPVARQSEFRDMADFIAAVNVKDMSRLRIHFDVGGAGARMSVNEGIPSEGGFLIPEEFARTIMDETLEASIVLPRARIWPMRSASLKVPGIDGGTRTSSVYGGIVASWLAEAGTASVTNPKFKSIELVAKKLAAFVSATDEWTQDTTGAYGSNPLEMLLPSALGFFLDDAFFNGSGAGRPLGILGAPCTITVAKETGQAADTIVYANLVKMFARHTDPSRAVWVCTQTAIPELMHVEIPIGTAGQLAPALNQSGSGFTLLTRPVLFTEKLPVLGDVGDLVLADFSQYYVGLRKEISLDRSNAVGWLTDELHFRGIMRVDGQPAIAAPIQPKNGDTLSPFVKLGARA